MKTQEIALVILLFVSGCAALPESQPTECPIHHEPLTEQLVMPHTGSPRLEYLKAEKSEFPFSGVAFSGDIAPTSAQSLQRTLVCPKCIKAEREWTRSHFW